MRVPRTMLLGVLCASVTSIASAGQPKYVHHAGAADMPSAADRTSHLIATARATCYERGDDEEALRHLAGEQHWHEQPEEKVRKHDTPFTAMVGGWTFENVFGVFAVMQSAIREPHKGHVCSVTTILASGDEVAAIREDFQRAFKPELAEEADRPDEIARRYWIARGDRPPIKASLIFVPATRSITIRMLYGAAWPLKS